MTSDMTLPEAKELMKNWLQPPREIAEQALAILIEDKGGRSWIELHPEVCADPQEMPIRANPRTWNLNLMPYREMQYGGRTLFVFWHHIEVLLTP